MKLYMRKEGYFCSLEVGNRERHPSGGYKVLFEVKLVHKKKEGNFILRNKNHQETLILPDCVTSLCYSTISPENYDVERKGKKSIPSSLSYFISILKG